MYIVWFGARSLEEDLEGDADMIPDLSFNIYRYKKYAVKIAKEHAKEYRYSGVYEISPVIE